MKKFIAGILVGVMLCLSVFAVESISAYTSDIKIFVNGKLLDAQPINYNGSAFVPLRAVAEAFDKEVAYHQDSNSVNIDDKVAVVPTIAPAPTVKLETKAFVESAPSVEDIDIYTYWGKDFVFIMDVKAQLEEVGLTIEQTQYGVQKYTIFDDDRKIVLTNLEFYCYTPSGTGNSKIYLKIEDYKKYIVPLLE